MFLIDWQLLLETKELRSQGGQVGCSPDFYPGSPYLTPARGNQQKKKVEK